MNSMMELVRGDQRGARVVSDVDVPPVVRAVVEDLHAAYPDRRIDTHLVPGSGMPLAGDPDRIHQAILNLGANACTHTPSSTPITIAVEAPTGAVEISVIDHGAGIDEAEQQRIFLPFYQADSSRARHGHGGVGLGLAVTQQIAREHHGSIRVGPTPGGGSTFPLRLPQGRQEADT